MVAGDLATALNVLPSNLSFHLKALTQAGLVTGSQEGRFQRYRANTALMMDLVAYLAAECCPDNPGDQNLLGLKPRPSRTALHNTSLR